MAETYYQKTAEEVLAQEQTRPEGLTAEEAAARLERYGKNALAEDAARTVLSQAQSQALLARLKKEKIISKL